MKYIVYIGKGILIIIFSWAIVLYFLMANFLLFARIIENWLEDIELHWYLNHKEQFKKTEDK